MSAADEVQHHARPTDLSIPAGESPSSQMPTREAGKTQVPCPEPREPPEPIESGQVLGQYRILERLGMGGMGEVYKAVHATMDRVVALKVLAPHLVRDAQAVARFQHEVRSAARLAHPNIVTAYDAAEDQGHFFLVMEYVEGTDLAALVSRHGLPPLAVACEIIRQTARGLQHAYEQGMVHRDIKPANLMIVQRRPGAREPGRGCPAQVWPPNLQVKILDFGLARPEADERALGADPRMVTREGTVVGTPEFMSPEQATHSHRLGIRSDLYSLGCTFYFLLTGRPPFVEGSVHEILTRHIKEAPPLFHLTRPDIPRDLAQLVYRLLAKLPEDRPQTPAEVAQALRPSGRHSSPSVLVAKTVAVDKPSAVAPDPTATPVPRLPPRLPPESEAGNEALHWLAAWFGFILALALAILMIWTLTRPAESSPGTKPPPNAIAPDKPWD